MSSSTKKWNIAPPAPSEFIAEHPELPEIIARLLWNRGFKTQTEIDEFLNPDYSTDIHDPFLFKDMPKAVDIIFAAIKNGSKITVHGDYDADGVCASVIIITALKKLGAKDVDVFLPHRETDGYGLNKKTIQYLKDTGTHLIITCDCGISNTPEVTLAKELGLNVVITDHHAMPKTFPPADAIIHPLVPGETYPDKTLAGGGVAFKLVQGLLAEHKKTNATLPGGGSHEVFEKWLLDLVAISTVADLVPLHGESRTLVRYGLTVLNKTKNLGLKKMLLMAGLIDDAGKPKRGAFSTQTIGFQLAPRINAAGRMDHANVAFKLLMAETDTEATALAIQLNQNNADRQKVTEELTALARKQIAETNQTDHPILFVYGKEWSAGVLGIVASRIKDEFYRPIFVMCDNQGNIVGSGRSVIEFNMIKTLQAHPELFSKFGGHPQACGFTLASPETLETFKTILLEEARQGTKGVDLVPQINVDAEVDLDDVSWKLYDILQKFEPFGKTNDEPRYVAYGVEVVSVDPVGHDGKHLRLLVKHHSHTMKKTIAFGFGDCERHPANWKEYLKPGDKVDLVFTVGVNEWNGNRELQLMLEDIKKTS
jgi:single-stranded-DNA-specific exonuclease